ncbi:MAG: hypothetical protein IKU72_03750 [Oscillospiraceae bacterium]|nr:hypothetical protein [Oscillospiraceae bacterium]
MKKVLIAGGLCGTTMLMAAQNVTEACEKQGIDVKVTVHNLWEGAAITGAGYDIVIEMFPYFENLSCPLLSGKPFIGRIGEKQLIQEIIELLKNPKEA